MMTGRTALILANAIVWVAVLVAVAVVLQGTGYFAKLLPILGGGAAASIVIVGGGISRLSAR
jgi:hypothetical protein